MCKAPCSKPRERMPLVQLLTTWIMSTNKKLFIAFSLSLFGFSGEQLQFQVTNLAKLANRQTSNICIIMYLL